MGNSITKARLAELEAKEKQLNELSGNKENTALKTEKSLSVEEVSLKEEADKHIGDFEKETEVFRCGVCNEITKSRDKCDVCGVEFA